ncbi:hypothetical protein TNCV_3739341 [Trichonephila clavipes]|nr:hypothetical protein TNCV_3739341 [Trichonephila clavipes]
MSRRENSKTSVCKNWNSFKRLRLIDVLRPVTTAPVANLGPTYEIDFAQKLTQRMLLWSSSLLNTNSSDLSSMEHLRDAMERRLQTSRVVNDLSKQATI